MRKLIQGIVDFREHLAPSYYETFSRLALGQKPDVLFIACSDSRMAANLFASTEPGDLFVIRNVGNMVAPFDSVPEHHDSSAGAAIEYAIDVLGVTDIVICGHSECGATLALLDKNRKLSPNLKDWLKNGLPSLFRLHGGDTLDPSLPQHNQLSQINVMQQLRHLQTYPTVQKAMSEGKLRIHGWWFNIAKVEVHTFDDRVNKFVPLDRSMAEHLMGKYEDLAHKPAAEVVPWQIASNQASEKGKCCTYTDKTN